jgi:hypothetical protein
MSSFALSLIVAASTVGSGTAAGPTDRIFDPPPMVRHQLEEGASKRAAFEAYRKTGVGAAKTWASPELPSTFDVTHYDLDLHVDPSAQVLSGSVTMDFTAIEDQLSEIQLDADLGLRVLSVLLLGDERFPYDTPAPLVFEHADDRLVITLPQPLPAGDRARLQVTYGGHAWRSGLIGSTGVNWYSNAGTPVIHTFAQPYGARIWWPCSDRPDDKATVSLTVTVPDDLDVAANGLERWRLDNGDGTATSAWSSIYPVPTYLVVMHISDFVYSESTYTGLDGTTMPVGLWAMPDVADQAETDLAVTVPQIEVMAENWGEYPFLNEKYGNATVFFGGGMEHQTMTTLSVFQVGNAWMQWLNVHELGHQWWGDWVTMDDWRHIWLNEGFATHTEWLWAEHLGPDVLAQYLKDEDWRGWFSGPVFDNPVPFSWTIYAKGSWVAWMLRHVIGDDAFFDAMASYRAEHAGGTATTDDLREAMEEAGNTELDWFFDQWVYGLYRPRYVYEWSNGDGSVLALKVRQVQTNTGLFRMPMNIRVASAAGTEDHRVWIEDDAEQIIEVQLQADATAVTLNPDTRVLCEIAHISEPDLELGPNFPDGYDFGFVGGTGTASRELPLSNVGGSDLVVSDIRPQGGSSFEIAELPQFPLTIAPGETHTLEIVFDPSGIGVSTDTFVIESNDPDRGGVVLVPVRGSGSLYDDALLAAPAAANVGRVPLGGTGETTFDVLNLGGQPLPVQTTVEGEGFFLAGTVPPVLAPGTTNPVRVRFHPTSVGTVEGSVLFHEGNPGQPLKTVRLIATGEGAPRLDVDPGVLSLGIGEGDATGGITVTNSGTEDLVISVLSVDPPFSLPETGNTPIVLSAGGSTMVSVGLEDAPLGTLAGHLTLHSNDPAIPVARLPLRAHVTQDPPTLSSFAAAASGPGLGDARWSSRAFLLNPTQAALQTDLVFRSGDERESSNPDAGNEVPARSQRVIPNLVAALGAAGTGGVNLRSSGPGLVAVSRTFASGSQGTYGQFIGAESHDDAVEGSSPHLLASLSGNNGFHTNIGVLNLTDDELRVDFKFLDATGAEFGSRRIHAQPGAFAQVVAVISKLTGNPIIGGYATFTTTDDDARYLAYASVVDDASHDPTLVRPQPIATGGPATDLVIPAVASLPGSGGTTWRSQLDVVNASDESRSVTVDFIPSDGMVIRGLSRDLEPAAVWHFDDVVVGLLGGAGKGWLRITSPGAGIHAASRTFNDAASGTFGQLIPTETPAVATAQGERVVLAGLSSEPGFRTNLGFTSLANETTVVTVTAYTNQGSSIGTTDVELPPNGFVQLERVLSDGFGFVGTAWAEVGSDDPAAAFFAHASVVDEATGDPIYIPAAGPGSE